MVKLVAFKSKTCTYMCQGQKSERAYLVPFLVKTKCLVYMLYVRWIISISRPQLTVCHKPTFLLRKETVGLPAECYTPTLTIIPIQLFDTKPSGSSKTLLVFCFITSFCWNHFLYEFCNFPLPKPIIKEQDQITYNMSGFRNWEFKQGRTWLVWACGLVFVIKSSLKDQDSILRLFK